MNKPSKEIVPMADGLLWRDDGAIYQEKLDGRFAMKHGPGWKLMGEQMAGGFVAWDCGQYAGQDCLMRPAAERLIYMNVICEREGIEAVKTTLNRVADFVADVFLRGGEGVVRKLGGYYEPMLACKRSSVFRCRVESINFENGVVDLTFDGAPAGRLALRDKSLLVRVGSVLKVEAYGRHKSGLLREARLDRDSEDSWLVQF